MNSSDGQIPEINHFLNQHDSSLGRLEIQA